MITISFVFYYFCDKITCFLENSRLKNELNSSGSSIEKVFLSQYYIVVNKPYDIRINTDNPFDNCSLHSRLYNENPALGDVSLKHYFYFVHRLDYATSGLICIALSKKACTEASITFEKRTAKKFYLAILRGHVSQSHLEISNSIGELVHSDGCAKMGVEHGTHAVIKLRKASTRLMVLEKGLFANYPATKVLLMPLTGRRHQLRVHCSHIGHTIVGDYTYSNRKDIEPTRMYLHSYRLVIPSKLEYLEVESKDPFTHSELKTVWLPVEYVKPLNSCTIDEISSSTWIT